MKNKIIKVTIALFLLFILSGCWNYNDLNDLAIVTSLSIDKNDDDIHIGLKISNPQNSQSNDTNEEINTTILEGSGKTITEAFEETNLKSSKRIYLDHLTSVIISEYVAREGVSNISDFLFRDLENRKKYYLLISKDSKAIDILKTSNPLESKTTNDITSNTQLSKESEAIINNIQYEDFIKTLITPGKQATVSSITISNDDKTSTNNKNTEQAKTVSTLKLGPLAIFLEDKLVGYSSDKESEAINIINNKAKQVVYTISCDEKYMSFSSKNPNTKIKTILENGKPKIDLTFSSNVTLLETDCNYNLNNQNTVKIIEKEINSMARKSISRGIKLAQQKYKSDIFGFGLIFYRNYPDYFKKVKKGWDEKTFSNIDVSIKTNIVLDNNGFTNNVISEVEQ